ncbi:Oidioi.mRNA.OKI2018_I69.XSR.g15665.t1.cds [Oikopleura dioica]|uniref:Oidioi.mRNA.OKI2018_I69.XSR.g15665.t1.cds n=1 Tax=Oikopleura dioica TaxID=34765 RepID=A0ABN7SDK3_OIKDI|nr:Oidioi.mRNA.OKI2018_I69.XSR.g15665.t1.cds [Oikopleura dioica]
MAKIYTNQKTQFENGETFRRLSRDSEIRYVGFMDRQLPERQKRLLDSIKEGRAEICFINTGIHIRLHFFPYALDSVHGMMPPKEYCDFEKEPGKLWFRSPMIMNGVCCSAVGYLNLTKLDGTARLEFDPDYARYEEVRCNGRTAPDPEEPNNNRSSSTSTSKTEPTSTSQNEASNTGVNTAAPAQYAGQNGQVPIVSVQQSQNPPPPAELPSVQFADTHSPATY